MRNDYAKMLPKHREEYVGENDLFLEVFRKNEGKKRSSDKEDYRVTSKEKPPILFVHGAYSGSWMWSKYLPHFTEAGWECYAMNMRSHYKSRVQDLTKISFEEYLEDIQEIIRLIIHECGKAPILIGHSMGGILGQKIAESTTLSGLVPLDTSICREVFEIAPYLVFAKISSEIIIPAPYREKNSMDETEEDVAFQVKYLTMESMKALGQCSFAYGAKEGISINREKITCPVLVISAINDEEDDRRGKACAEHLNGEYLGLWNRTHTGLLVGQKYQEAVDRILEWAEDL